MARTELGRLLRSLHREARCSIRTGMPIDEVHDWSTEMSRRRFLIGSMGLGAAAMLPSLGCSSSSEVDSDAAAGLRVAVVGGGLAGLTCAFRLSTAGADVTVHEASGLAGGRTRTLRDFFADDRTAESGGEFVNSDHRAMRSLVGDLGLDLEDLYEGYPSGTGQVWSFDGAIYRRTDALADWREVAPLVERDFALTGADPQWDDHPDSAVALDRLSLAGWVDMNVPGGRSSRLGKLIEVTYLGEWGGATEDQSAISFITGVGDGANGSMDLVAGDERWHVSGGNDRVAGRLVDEIGADRIELRSSLAAVRRRANGATCTFDQAGTMVDADVDRVVFALPFSALRRVDLEGAELSERKRRVIAEQPMGTNAKLHLEFSERAWRDDGADGDSASDTGLMVTWEDIITEPGPTGVLVAFTGGERGASYDVDAAHGPAEADVVAATYADLETVFGPRTPAAATGRGWLDSWVDNPHTQGSYSYWGLGHYTELRGAGSTPDGPFHFCGEHTSLGHQGFMNGAVESGERAATEILSQAP